LIGLSNHNSLDFNIYDAKGWSGEDKINLRDLDFYSKKSFPPCMKTLLTALRNTNYLKNYGRLQLGLFIKGLGLKIDEA